jgi:hypothetical protein
MTASTRLAAWVSLMTLGACTDAPTTAIPRDVSAPLTISHAPTGGTAGFYFLPPMVAAATTFSGAFDPGRSPSVRVICTGATGSSCPTIATFQSGVTAGSIKVDPIGESYGVVWQVPATLSVGRLAYRVQVFDGAALLGSADLSVVAKQGDTKTIPPTEVAVVRGSTLHIKFRIEKATLGPPITAELPVAGGRIDVPVGGGTLLTITVPAGAVTTPVSITITPKVPRPGSLAAVSVSPSNLLFHKPITIGLTLGSQLPADEAARKALVFFTPATPTMVILPTTVGVGTTGPSFTASTAVLGYPQPEPIPSLAVAVARPASLTFSVAADESTPTDIELYQATTAEKIAAYRAAADELEATLSFESAIQLRLAAAVLLQLVIDDPAGAAAELEAARDAACGALDKHLTLAEGRLGSEFSNLWTALRPVLSWTSATAELNVTAANCAAAAAAPGILSGLVGRFVELYEAAMKRETFKQNADALGDELWEALRVREMGALLGLPDEFGMIKSGIQLPLATALRQASYDWCRSDLEHAYTGRLLIAAREGKVYPPSSPQLDRLAQTIEDRIAELGYDAADVSDDIQYCGTTLTVRNKAPNGSLVAELPLGGNAELGVVIPEQTVDAFPTGSIEIDGTLLAFSCPDGTIGDDRIAFEFDGVRVRELTSLSPLQAFIRNGPVTFSVQALAQAANISASNGGTHALRMYRESDECGGDYRLLADRSIVTRKPLATVWLRFQTITIAVSPTSVAVTTGQQASFAAIVTGALTSVVTWSATGGTITQGGVFTAGTATGTFTVTAAALADPTKTATAQVTIAAPTGPPPGSSYTLNTLGSPTTDNPIRFQLRVVNIPAITEVRWTFTARTTEIGIGDLSNSLTTSVVAITIDQYVRDWLADVLYPSIWRGGRIGYSVTITARACAFDAVGTPLLNIAGSPLCTQVSVTP